MKRGWKGAFIGFLLGVFSTGAAFGQSDSFVSQVEEIDRYFHPETSTIYSKTRWLVYLPNFEKLSSTGDSLVDESLSYLSDGGHTQLQRRIAILATHKVSLTAWIRFSNKMLDMHDSQLVDLDEVLDAILPRHIYSTYAIDYFWKTDVRHILHRLYQLRELDSNTRCQILADMTGMESFLGWLFGREPYD